MTLGKVTRWLLAAAAPFVLWCCDYRAPPPADEMQPAVQGEPTLSDEAYLLRLGLMRGHLLVGHAMYGLGALDAARTHSKHPTDELFAGMVPEFRVRGAVGFGPELQAHAMASHNDDGATVDKAYAVLTEAISKAEGAVEAPPTMVARVVVALLREAADEYAVGIVDGKLADAHEYQDAYGFTQIALAWAEHAGDSEGGVFARIAERIEALSSLWPNLTPPPVLAQKAARLYGAAAEVEILALELSDPQLGRDTV